MDTTIYKLILSCGHTQLVLRPLNTGAGYPCWTACSLVEPTQAYVVDVEHYNPNLNEALVVVSGDNTDILHAQKIADVVNSRL